MTDQYIQLPTDSAGKKVDTSELIVNGQTVERERINIADPTTAAGLAAVKNSDSASSDYGLIVRPLPTPGNATVLAGQQAVTASAVALATNSCRKLAVKANTANTINVYVGASGVSTTTGLELAPGDFISLDVSNTNLVYVIASTTGASVSWVATN